MKSLLRALALACIVLTATPSLSRGTTDLEEQLATMLAKITANECSLNHSRPSGMALIWQTIRRHGRSSARRIAWLRRHSSCVFGDVAPEDRPEGERPRAGSNCWWTWHLNDTDDAPTNFTTSWILYRERWALMRDYAKHLVAGRVPRGGWPCRVDPDTWGGPDDRRAALDRGMIPVGCVGAGRFNEGYLYPRNAHRLPPLLALR